MIYCRHCAHQIHETAKNCPSCGGAQISNDIGNPSANANTGGSSSVASLIFGIFSILVWFDDSSWDTDTYTGVFVIFILPAFIFGAVSLSKNSNGRGIAISGLVMSVISFLALLGSI